MLRQAIADSAKYGRLSGAARKAQKLLETLPAQVTNAEGADVIEWQAPKPRDVADNARLSVLEALESLAK
jgi:hypothetical protein